MLNKFLQSVLHPERYHGNVFRPPFFEGWYFKLVTEDQQNAFAVIPGVSLTRKKEQSHAFVQVLEGNSGAVHVFRYPLSAFRSDSKSFNISIGENHFSLDGVSLSLEDNGFSLSGRIRFGEMHPWPVKFHSPGIMGPFGWLGFMECYHGLLGFDHALTGYLLVQDGEVQFSNGRGYIEKDWGKAFPSSWIWMQTNHFKQQEVSLSASIATIPFLGGSFAGIIVGLWHEGKLHTFATYNGAKIIHFSFDEHFVGLTLRRGCDEIKIQAERKNGGYLEAPTLRGMDRRILESLNAKITVQLCRDGRLIFEDTGERAGLEIVGDITRLQKLGKT